MVSLRRLTRVDTFRNSHKIPFRVIGHKYWWGPAWLSDNVSDSQPEGLRFQVTLDPLGCFCGNVLGQDTSEP